jgi:hypothetical protein
VSFADLVGTLCQFFTSVVDLGNIHDEAVVVFLARLGQCTAVRGRGAIGFRRDVSRIWRELYGLVMGAAHCGRPWAHFDGDCGIISRWATPRLLVIIFFSP